MRWTTASSFLITFCKNDYLVVERSLAINNSNADLRSTNDRFDEECELAIPLIALNQSNLNNTDKEAITANGNDDK